MNGSGVVRRAMAVAGALLAAATLVACQPTPLGTATAQLGNDPSNCAQYQPAPQAPCGPQPMVWAAIQGPYESFANGDPYATKCGRNLTQSASACSSGPYAGGATNELYDPTGYEYAIEVGPDDVGVPLAVEVYDAGSYPRTAGSVTTTTTTVSMSAGSATLNRTGGTSFAESDVGKPISGTGIPAGATVASYVNSNRIILSTAALSSSVNRTVTVQTTPDCNKGAAPFTTAPYQGSVTSQNCQAGDSGTTPIQFQVFDDDGDDLRVSYDAPLDGCELYLAPGAGASLYKNAWAPVCTFVPGRAGIYPVRVKSSAIVRPDGTVVADTGSGYNNFSLRVGGGSATRLYALDALSLWTNTPGSSPVFYLAEITSAHAGERVLIDLYDVGDGSGSGSQYTVQVLAPPGGAPGQVPSDGTAVPAAGIADSCRYNPTASPTKGPDVTGAGGADAAACTVVTRAGSTNQYNNGWLRIEVDLAEDYACESDCWWTIRYDFGGASGIPTDRTVWSVSFIDPSALPTTTTTEPTTTTTESTTTTTESTTTTTASTTTTTDPPPP